MHIMKTIPGLAVIIGALGRVRKYKKPIDTARAAGEVEKEQALILEACQQWSAEVAEGLDIQFHVIHPENLPEKGPVVFISNHQSYADILAFLSVVQKHQVAFIAKDALEKIPILGQWVVRIRGIFIRRGDVRASLATINEGVSYLQAGFSLVIFPEGTRSHSSAMGEFKPGSFKLATKAKVPLVPVTINGGYRSYEEPGYVKKGNTIDVLVHPPVDTAALDRHQLAELPQQVETIIRNGLAELTDEAWRHG